MKKRYILFFMFCLPFFGNAQTDCKEPVYISASQEAKYCEGELAEFKVVAANVATYQWEAKAPGTSVWFDLTGGTSTTSILSFTANRGGNYYSYRCRMTGNCGTVIYNPIEFVAFIYVASAGTTPIITSPSTTITQTATELTTTKLAVSASQHWGYQWQYSASAGNWVNIEGEKASELTVEALLYKNGFQYRCLLKGCASKFSPAITLSVTPNPNAVNLNYVKETILLKEADNNTDVANLPVEDRTVNTSYFDGLGKIIQSVNWQGSPSKHDVVQPASYDNFERETRKYLPFVSAQTTGAYVHDYKILDGAGNYIGEPQTFYAAGSANRVADDSKPWSETIFEPSPENRVLKQGAAGNDWQPDRNADDHSVRYGYSTNIQQEILQWEVVNDVCQLSPQRHYTQRELFLTVTKNENWRSSDGNEGVVKEYKDKQGRVILNRTYANNQVHDTYYVYDQWSNLRFVLPPEASDRAPLITDAAQLKILLDALAFQYMYDGRNRMIQKKMPGADPVFMVYDKRDRVVLTQDGNQRNASTKQWFFTKYDELNRPIMTGIKDTAVTSQSVMQQVVDDWYGEMTTKTWRKWGETFQGTSGKIHGYSNNSYPQVTTGATLSANSYLTVTYYDNYNFKSLWTAGYDYESDNLSETVSGVTYTQPGNTNFNQKVIGQITGTKTKVLDGLNTWLKTANYFDKNYHVVQSKSDNQKQGIDKTSTLYDFVGKVLKTKTSYSTYDVSWTEVVGANVIGGNLIRSAASTGWNQSGAISVQKLAAGKDGWIEIVVTQPASNKRRMVGLADTNPDTHYTSINYAFYILNYLYVYENGVKAYTSSGTLTEGEVVRIERVGTTVKYYRNGTLIYTSGTPSTTQLFVDAAIYDVSTPVGNLKASFSNESLEINKRFTYDHAGRLTSTFHKLGNGEPVTWASITGLVANGQLLTKQTGTAAWNAGAFSTQSIAANTDGWLEFPAYEVSKAKMLGLSDVNTNVNYTSIDHAFYLSGTTLYVYENGVNVMNLGTFNANDVFRIERINGVVNYKKNGTTLFTSQVTLTSPSTAALYADCSFNSVGGNLYAVYLGMGAGYSEVEIARSEYNELGQPVDKKIHLHPGTTQKQSVDYRYNIRGWVTSLNNAALTADASVTNDDANDYFGMNLSYNIVDADLGNKQAFNGNISGIKWSSYPGTGLVKQKGYTYQYDAMNRITGSFYREKGTSWTEPSNNGFDERGYAYDLNGNITRLMRFDKAVTGFMDSLVYNYGTGNSRSNKLVSVTDHGDDFTGFKDGNGSATDYAYDKNGNMTSDLNKGISTIAYNHLNLPVTITKGGNTITYVYDAAGRKISQIVRSNGTHKQTDYLGELVYENDVLQFVTHEEGRVVTAETRLMYTHACGVTSGFNAISAMLNPTIINGAETYLQVTSTAATAPAGIDAIGDGLPVVGGNRYKVRIKGYHVNAAATNLATLLVKVDGQTILGTNAALPKGVANESWIEVIFDVAGTPTQRLLQLGIMWQGNVAANESFMINEIEVEELLSTSPEYQYYLKDHLGNVRVTFTTKQETTSETATMETAYANGEAGKFLYYSEAKKVNEPIFDHTNGSSGTTYATRLTGQGTNAIYGIAKSLSVVPGDVVNMEVYAKYVDSNTANWTNALTTLMTAVANVNAPGGISVDGGQPGSLGNGSLPFTPVDHASETGAPPKAYLNYIVFDNTMTRVVNTGYARITLNSREYGQDCAHDRLALTYNVKEPGYIYIYLSNENPTPVEVYFDDFKVDQVKSPIIQTQDYYAFGLTYNSYARENTVLNDIKFQGQEHQDELELGWDSFKWRNHQPDIGRFFNVDPLAEKYYYNSPYAFSENKVVAHVELEGLESSYGPLNQEIKKVEDAWNKFVYKVEKVVDKVVETLTVPKEPEFKKVDENQSDQRTSTDLEPFGGPTDAPFNPDATPHVEDNGSKTVNTTEGGQQGATTDRTDNSDLTVKEVYTSGGIDTVGTSGNTDQYGNIYNKYFVIRNGKDTIDERGYVPDYMMPKKVVPASTNR